MKESIFIDTGFWIALFDNRDKKHFSAKTSSGILQIFSLAP
jgi:predicted nucleic acid-binding protein